MSLINDALKKAQRQRDEGTTPAPEVSSPDAAPEQLHRVARRAKPAGFRTQLMLIGGGAVAAVVLLGIGAMFFFRSSEQPATSPVQPPQIANPAPAVATPPVAATPTPAAPATPAIVVQAPAAPTPPPVSAPAAALPVAIVTPPAAAPTAPAPQFSLPPAPVAEVAPIAANPAPTERPKASTRMIGVIEHYKVGGIRMAGPDSKVLMNDKVYRLNDIVDYELNIRLTSIEAKALTFEDARGAVHVRTF